VAEAYVGRFAPSPTGPLHFGSLLAAMASYADALAHNGKWLVRIEDVDTPRSQAGAAEHILRTLSDFGFRWDGEVVVQSERKEFYENALTTLQTSDMVFACACTRKMLEAQPQNVSGERMYPGTCLKLPLLGGEGWGEGRSIATAQTSPQESHPNISNATPNTQPPSPQPSPPGGGSSVALRLQVPSETILWTDRLLGAQSQHLANDVGAFIIKRSDGLFAYQLAVVVDDALQGITHIVRGADLLSSTARQTYLQRLLNVPTPQYLHIPVAVNGRGEKLSKQTLAPALDAAAALPTLQAAWRALNQAPAPSVATHAEFWAHAARAWSVARLPRMLTLSV
jgi:glutamyl-Q tRNA(Asp) synthetase